jgi:hypothetical protein
MDNNIGDIASIISYIFSALTANLKTSNMGGQEAR